MATDPEPNKRDPGRAVKLAKEAVGLAPKNGAWNTLGAAHYRAGNWEESLAALYCHVFDERVSEPNHAFRNPRLRHRSKHLTRQSSATAGGSEHCCGVEC